MKLRLLVALCVFLASGGAALADGSSIIVKPKAAERFVTLPKDVNFPEGIAANPKNGDIYVATFDFGDGQNVLVNEILRYNRKGKLLATRSGLPPLLGLAFNPRDNKLYFANFGQSKVQRVAADLSGAVEDVATIPYDNDPANLELVRFEGNPDGSQDKIVFGSNPNPTSAPNRAPNALVFGKNGDLYISDSFQGRIYQCANPANRVCGGFVEDFALSGKLATAGFPPFGANGLAFNEDESILYIANTGDDRVYKFAVNELPNPNDPSDSRITVFAQSVNGADGLAFDKRTGLLWVAANQADEVVALDTVEKPGRVVARLGAFLGFDKKGGKVAARGLLFPASLAIVGDSIFVTNTALRLTGTPDEPETEVDSYTISRIRIPDERDRDDRDD